MDPARPAHAIVGASIGIAIADVEGDEGESAKRILQIADDAMYEAKRSIDNAVAMRFA